ncbi:uncharacterized protein LOC132511541 [Lagenorhynchus albirostris]|uniref:uncharacterized protein LOC132511541 n=1 Tax=Lagenorhynchus albirostris TaxID=27610 RepID=UPI0028E7C24D|nr:uncharacterized protein LOC132511541 [Lagenorhynchus albirostris]
MPPTPLVRPLHSSSPDPAARIRDGNSRLPGSAPFFQPPRRNLGQGRRDQIQSLALLGQPPRPPRIAGLQDCGDSPAQTPATSFIFLSRWKFSLALAPHRHVLRGSPPLPGRGLGYSGIHSTPKRYQIRCGSLRNGLFGKYQHQPNPGPEEPSLPGYTLPTTCQFLRGALAISPMPFGSAACIFILLLTRGSRLSRRQDAQVAC